MDTTLNTNSIAFIALCNEFCIAAENARESTREEFLDAMLHLLPRIYISAYDLEPSVLQPEDSYIENALDEDYYDAVRRNIEALFGEYDVYLEAFEENMKYSDTPVAASISEGICDIFQVLYNFISTVREAPNDTVNGALAAVTDDFRAFWSQTLCNTFRALNHLKMNI